MIPYCSVKIAADGEAAESLSVHRFLVRTNPFEPRHEARRTPLEYTLPTLGFTPSSAKRGGPPSDLEMCLTNHAVLDQARETSGGAGPRQLQP